MMQAPNKKRFRDMGLGEVVAFDPRVLPVPSADSQPQGYAAADSDESWRYASQPRAAPGPLRAVASQPEEPQPLEGDIAWPEGASAGFELQWVAERRLELRSDEPVTVVSESGDLEGFALLSDRVVRWALPSTATSAAFVRADGTGAWVDVPAGEGSRPIAWLIDSDELEAGASFDAAIDVEGAIALVADDPWLAGYVRERAADGDAWDALCAVGLIDRLYKPPPKVRNEAWRQLLQTGVSGLPEPGLAAVRRLEPEALRLLDRMAASAVALLADDLAEAFSAIDPDDPAWCSVMQLHLETRDDLEGIRQFLAEVGAGPSLTAALEVLDAEMVDATAQLPEFDVPDRARLLRVGIGRPMAWWVQIGLPAVDDAAGGDDEGEA